MRALILPPAISVALTPAVRRQSNLNFLFPLSIKFYRLVSSSVARGSISERSEANPKTASLHGLAEIKQWNRSRTGNCGNEPSGDRPDGSFYCLYALARMHGRSIILVPFDLKRTVPLAQEPRALLKTSSCLASSTSLDFACRPLWATSVQVTDCPRSIPCSPPSSSPSCGGGAPAQGTPEGPW